MLDGSVSIISMGGQNITLGTMVVNFLMLGRDHNDDFFCTKSMQIFTQPGTTTWRQITANSVNIICTPDAEFWTSTGWKSAGALTGSDNIYGLSGTSTYNFGSNPSHASVANSYSALFQGFAVTANNPHVQTAMAYSLRTTVGRYFANRFLVRD